VAAAARPSRELADFDPLALAQARCRRFEFSLQAIGRARNAHFRLRFSPAIVTMAIAKFGFIRR